MVTPLLFICTLVMGVCACLHTLMMGAVVPLVRGTSIVNHVYLVEVADFIFHDVLASESESIE
jgi:hypothetical protein